MDASVRRRCGGSTYCGGDRRRHWTSSLERYERPFRVSSGSAPWEGIAERTYVYDIAGNEIAAYELENSQPVSIGQIPPDVLAAVLAVEDREFYNHHGVNVRAYFARHCPTLKVAHVKVRQRLHNRSSKLNISVAANVMAVTSCYRSFMPCA